ncbi:MAG: hypothetical protein U1F10_16160 [Burkholderiales bacterium]
MHTTKMLLLVGGAALALAGCGTTGTAGGGPGGGTVGTKGVNPECPSMAALRQPVLMCPQGGNDCGVPVEIVPDGQGGCMVDVNVDVVQMKGNASGRSTYLFWWIATPGPWEFRVEPEPFEAPVIFKDNVPAARETFSPPRVSANGRTVFIENRNKGNTKFNYKIRVYRKNPGTPPLESPDPAIFNDG